jgi:hypothetical protein
MAAQWLLTIYRGAVLCGMTATSNFGGTFTTRVLSSPRKISILFFDNRLIWR